MFTQAQWSVKKNTETKHEKPPVTLAGDEFRAMSQEASGPSSHVKAPVREEAVIWQPPCSPKASASNWPGCPMSQCTIWSVSQWALLEAGLGSAGYRAQMGHWWGLLSSSPLRTWETGVFMCHLLAETKGRERNMRKWNVMWRYEIGSKNPLNRNQ